MFSAAVFIFITIYIFTTNKSVIIPPEIQQITDLFYNKKISYELYQDLRLRLKLILETGTVDINEINVPNTSVYLVLGGALLGLITASTIIIIAFFTLPFVSEETFFQGTLERIFSLQLPYEFPESQDINDGQRHDLIIGFVNIYKKYYTTDPELINATLALINDLVN